MPKILSAESRSRRRAGERCCDRETRPRLGAEAARRTGEDLALLAHPVRLQLLDILSRNAGRVCVCDLEAALPVKQPTVSHHLAVLREAGLVGCERDGLWAYSRVEAEALGALRARLAAALDALG